jgi:hypothetical protein
MSFELAFTEPKVLIKTHGMGTDPVNLYNDELDLEIEQEEFIELIETFMSDGSVEYKSIKFHPDDFIIASQYFMINTDLRQQDPRLTFRHKVLESFPPKNENGLKLHKWICDTEIVSGYATMMNPGAYSKRISGEF